MISAQAEIALETRSLSKQYDGLRAVTDVSMQVKVGEIVGLIGPNGAGKTTFINAIAGLAPPTSGSVLLFGEDATGLRPEEMCHRGLSRTFQIPRPFPKMTALENVMVASVFGRADRRAGDAVRRAREQLERVGFPLDENVRSAKLNVVQLKRLDLARALASSPRLLLLDELASGLTGAELTDLMHIIRRIRDSGVTILMVEHIMRVIMDLCDRLVVLHFGNKIAEGPTLEVAGDPKVAEAYLGRRP
ncbi:MAG: ABC transporter ATP-binding protein [Thermodesulfobacteriota bacterium]